MFVNQCLIITCILFLVFMYRKNLLFFTIGGCPHCSNICLLLLALNHSEESVLNFCPYQVFIHMHKMPVMCYLSRLSNAISLSLSILLTCSNTFIIFVALCCIWSTVSKFCLYQEAQDWTQHSLCGLSGAEERQRVTLSTSRKSDAAPDAALEGLFAPLATRACCRLIVHSDHQSLLCKVASQPVSSCVCSGYCHPSECQHNHVLHQPFPSALYHLRTC